MKDEDIKKLKLIMLKKIDPALSIEDIEPDKPLVDYGIGIDSVANMELILEIEKILGVEIDESEINSEILYNLSSIMMYLDSLDIYHE